LSNPHLSEDDPPKILRVSTGDGGSADDWDLVLDEDFVHAGRAEPTAAERAERAARISRDHATAPSWRGSPASATIRVRSAASTSGGSSPACALR